MACFKCENEKIPNSNYMEIAKIKRIGTRYYGHANQSEIECELDMKGSGCCFSLAPAQVPKFVGLFADLNQEDNFWLHELEGKYLLAYFAASGHIVGVAELQNPNNFIKV